LKKEKVKAGALKCEKFGRKKERGRRRSEEIKAL
jgi:hypothetical protein